MCRGDQEGNKVGRWNSSRVRTYFSRISSQNETTKSSLFNMLKRWGGIRECSLLSLHPFLTKNLFCRKTSQYPSKLKSTQISLSRNQCRSEAESLIYWEGKGDSPYRTPGRGPQWNTLFVLSIILFTQKDLKEQMSSYQSTLFTKGTCRSDRFSNTMV